MANKRHLKTKTKIGFEGTDKKQGSWCTASSGKVDGETYICIDSLNTPCLTAESAKEFAEAILEMIQENIK